MAYIEPCCVDNQLPQLLRKNAPHAVTFQTLGDVTLTKFLRAVCCMVDGGTDLWLAVPALDAATVRILRHWIKMDWIMTLHVITADDQHDLLNRVIGAEWMRLRVRYAVRPDFRAELFVYAGPRQAVSVQGALPLTALKPGALTVHSAIFGTAQRLLPADAAVGSLLANLRPLFNVPAPAPEPEPEPEPAPETEPAPEPGPAPDTSVSGGSAAGE